MVRVVVRLFTLLSLGAAAPVSDIQRLEIYLENAKLVEAHNRNPNKTFTLALNKFSHLTPEEYGRLQGLRVPAVRPPSNWDAAAFANAVVSDEVDWRNEGIVSQVKSQGWCGSCWAFAAVAALEGQHAKKRGELVEFSEQNLVDCSRAFGNEGCDGGWPDNAYEYVKQNGGIDTEDSYPYKGDDENCRFNNNTVGETDKGYVDLPRGDEEALQRTVAIIGPVSVGLNAHDNKFKQYHGGVLYIEGCPTDEPTHAVTVVGYGTDENTGEDYWLIKNSWDTNWGENGYLRLARNRGNNCGVASYASYPIV